MTDLGRLERVDLREIWETEGQHFTPWLAQEENLQVLGDAIQLDLELEAQEKDVGPFRADILCKDTDTDNWVLIENQLERTDHVHLGQLLTYASGLNAVTIVWIAANFTDEHRAALDWLNEITDESFKFFGLEVELWKIGASPAAPKFNIVSKPNDWTRSVGQASRRIAAEALTDAQKLYQRFWTGFSNYVATQNTAIRPQKAPPKHWTSFGIGRSGMFFGAVCSVRNKRINAELYMHDHNAKAFFHLLHEGKDEIEKEFGMPLDWQELPDRRATRIAVYKEGTDPTDEVDWQNQHAWLLDMLGRFDRVFRDRVQRLDAADWEHDDEAEEVTAG